MKLLFESLLNETAGEYFIAVLEGDVLVGDPFLDGDPGGV
jgi:hypothetical protein